MKKRWRGRRALASAAAIAVAVIGVGGYLAWSGGDGPDGPSRDEIEAEASDFQECMANAGLPLKEFELTITRYKVATSYGIDYGTEFGTDEQRAVRDRCEEGLMRISSEYEQAADPPYEEVERVAFACIEDGGGDPEDPEATPTLSGECFRDAQIQVLGAP